MSAIGDRLKAVFGTAWHTNSNNCLEQIATEIENSADAAPDVTPGTVAANKTIVAGATKNVDTLDIATPKIGGVAVTATAAELNANHGVTPGTALASGTVVLDASKKIDVLDITQLKVGGTDKSNVIIGDAGGYKISRSAAPVALDGSNPTSFAHGLTTCVAVFVQLVGSAAPGVSTSVLTPVVNGANIDVYAWKPTSNANPTLIASTGTETFNWIAIGT